MLKAALLATLLFWLLIISDENNFDSYLIGIIIISYIPIFMVCSVTILFTIVPFFLIEKKDISNDKMFKKYFPYYTVVVFVISLFYTLTSNYKNFTSAFFITALFTLMQTWIWLCKPKLYTEKKITEKKLVSS